MAITESKRYELHQGLEEMLGRERADTLMEHLPPVGWADVATKQDVAQLEARIEMSELRITASMERAMRVNTLVTVGVLGTLTSVVSAITASL